MSVDESSLVVLKDVLKKEVPFQREIQSRKERAAVWNHQHSSLGLSHPRTVPFALQLPFPCLGTPHFSAGTAVVGCEVVFHFERRATTASDRPLFSSSGRNCTVCDRFATVPSVSNILTTESYFLMKKNNHIYGKTWTQEVFRLKHQSSPLGQHRRPEDQNKTNKTQSEVAV